ncbi:hypothetical protein R4Y59_002731 [Enterococcus faecalis]|nr:hypothetical protein [Enterococcus faecalis]
MKETNKAKRIIDELLTYFFLNDIEKICINIDITPQGLFINMQGETKEKPKNLIRFLKLLNSPRDLSIENYYDELLGLNHHEEEDYHLLGLMIDEAEICFDAPVFSIKIFRKNNYSI